MVGFAVQLKHFSMKNESLYSLKEIIYNMMASFFFSCFYMVKMSLITLLIKDAQSHVCSSISAVSGS